MKQLNNTHTHTHSLATFNCIPFHLSTLRCRRLPCHKSSPLFHWSCRTWTRPCTAHQFWTSTSLCRAAMETKQDAKGKGPVTLDARYFNGQKFVTNPTVENNKNKRETEQDQCRFTRRLFDFLLAHNQMWDSWWAVDQSDFTDWETLAKYFSSQISTILAGELDTILLIPYGAKFS